MAPIAIAETIVCYLIGNTTFDAELQELQRESTDRHEILAINVSHNMNLERQQKQLLRIHKLETRIKQLSSWELDVDVTMATLNSMQQHWSLHFF